MKDRIIFNRLFLGFCVASLLFAGCAKTTTVKLEELEASSVSTAIVEEGTVPKETTLPVAIPVAIPNEGQNETESTKKIGLAVQQEEMAAELTEPEETENIAPIPAEQETQKAADEETETVETETPETAASETLPEETEPNPRDYVLNKNSKKIHYPSCTAVRKMSKKNRQDYVGTMKELKEMGYEPCGKCRPR